MIRSFVKTAWRSLWRNKQASVINITGLALGLAVFLLIMQFVAFEWSVNRFHKNADWLYRVQLVNKAGEAEPILPPGWAPAMKQNLPGVQQGIRYIEGLGAGVLSYSAPGASQPVVFRENDVAYVEESFLEVFSFPVVSGSAKLPANTMAIAESSARKLFGTGNAIGKTVTVSNQFGNTLYTVGAVYKDITANSDLRSAVLLSVSTLAGAANRDGNDWADPAGMESGFSSIYLLLNKNADADAVTRQLNKLIASKADKEDRKTAWLQPLRHMHLAPSFSYPLFTYGSLPQVAIFSAIALLILIIAWVNYVNLSVAQTLKRTHEVGVRKVLGARRGQIVAQYLTETFFITLAACMLALVLVELVQPLYNGLTGKSLSLRVLNSSLFLPGAIGLVLASAMLAGGSVALTVSRFRPVSILRGMALPSGKPRFRTALVVFQFTASIVMIIAALVIHRQLSYMQTENLGMNLNELLVLKGPTVATEEQAERNVAFKNVLGGLAFVKKQSASNNVPGKGYNFSANGILRAGGNEDDRKKSYNMFITDHRFFDTWGIQFAQGRSYQEGDADRGWMNSRKLVINESAMKALGFRENTQAVGQKILWGEPYEIVGVVKDYHHLSLREPIQPVIYLPSVSFVYFTIQTDTRNLPEKLSALKSLYATHFPGNPFEYFFADESFDEQYKAEQKLRTVFELCSIVAVLIACLGLFGMVSFTARQRVKEIGIRKVLGAGLQDIALLLSKDFFVLVFIALLIASPLAWWMMQRWLQDFAYRTEIGWWVFLVAGGLIGLLTLLTVGLQAIKSANANPVKNLRTE
jgi:putative ABC transport system permease protein